MFDTIFNCIYFMKQKLNRPASGLLHHALMLEEIKNRVKNL